MAFVLLVVVGHSASAASIVLNGGFETGDLTDWHSNTVLVNGPWVASSILPNSGTWAAQAGCSGANCITPDPASNGNWLYQDLATTSGATYSLSFAYVSEGTPTSPTELQALWGPSGSPLTAVADLVNLATTSYHIYTYSNLQATSSSTRLEFLGRNDISFLYIDDVSVVPVPEPATVLLVMAGVLGLAFAGRKRGLRQKEAVCAPGQTCLPTAGRLPARAELSFKATPMRHRFARRRVSNRTRLLAKASVVAGLLAMWLARSAHADVIYQYTGPAFHTPPLSLPHIYFSYPYTGLDFISATIDLPSALPANSGYLNPCLNPGDCTSFTVSDGVNTITGANGASLVFNSILTNAAGLPDFWQLSASPTPPVGYGVPAFQDSSGNTSAGQLDSVSAIILDQPYIPCGQPLPNPPRYCAFYQTQNLLTPPAPGESQYWTMSTVPEPGTLLLLGSGLAGLTALRRRQRV